MTAKRSIRLGGLVLAVAVAATPVRAQVYIDYSNMFAAADRQREMDCQRGIPSWPIIQKRVVKHTNALMVAYAKAAATGPNAMVKLFKFPTESRWRGPDLQVYTPDAIRDPYVSAGLTPVVLVIGDDGNSSRGVWKATVSGPDGPRELFYSADFVAGPMTNAFGWKIEGMSVSTSPPPAEQLTRFCHLKEAKPLL